MNDYLKAQIEEHCQMVKRGVKPVSMLTHQERYSNEVIDFVIKSGCQITSKILSEGWRVIYIYTNRTLRYVLAELPNEPKTVLDHYVLGCIFGYDTESICNYITEHCKLDEPNIF